MSSFNITNIRNALYHMHAFGIRSMIRQSINALEFTKNYTKWIIKNSPDSDTLHRQKASSFSLSPKISIIVPTYKTPELFLRQMIDSVINQTYSNWELCIADGSSDDNFNYITDTIAKYQATYPNIQYKKLSANLGISGNTNAALTLATGDYIALLDHDDLLAPNALYEIVAAINQDPTIDVLYTDEDKVDISVKNYYDPYFKPDFNLDLLRSCNYITHFFVVRKQIADTVGGFSEECNGSQDYDFILKNCELASRIYHIPRVLYHWRIHPASVAGDPESKSYAYEAAVRALQNHLARTGTSGTVTRDSSFGYYRINYSYPSNATVSVCLIDCATDLENEILSTVPSSITVNFVSDLNTATDEYILVLYKVEKILNSNWLESMLGNCTRRETGLVSGRICYKKDRVLECGLLFTPDGKLHSPFYQFHTSDFGYCRRAQTQHNCSFIGPHFFMAKASTIKKYTSCASVRELIDHIYELSLKLTKDNLLITVLPQISVLCTEKHLSLPQIEECRGKQDPYYNPNFSKTKIYHLS